MGHCLCYSRHKKETKLQDDDDKYAEPNIGSNLCIVFLFENGICQIIFGGGGNKAPSTFFSLQTTVHFHDFQIFYGMFNT